MLTLRDIRVERQGRSVLQLPALQLDGRAFTVILGHNGSGKSTLMNLLARQLQPDQGQLQLNGQPLNRLSARQFARAVAYLPQRLPEVAGLTVAELVGLGRYPWQGAFGRWSAADSAIVAEAMRAADVTQHAGHEAELLSGGERQRAWIAMLLAQQSPLLLLDEPTSALDLAHQYQLMGLLRQLNRDSGRGVVVVLHDINLAARHADRIVALQQGRLYFDGSPLELLHSPRLSGLYGVDIQLLPQAGQPCPVAVVA